jgi:hypothetical protein
MAAVAGYEQIRVKDEGERLKREIRVKDQGQR